MVDTSLDLEQELCMCGRYAWKVHCSACGSAQTYALKKRDYVTRSLGNEAVLVVHQCRRCGNMFNDDDWKLRCQAPHVKLGNKGGRPPTVLPAVGPIGPPVKFKSLDEAPSEMVRVMNELKKKRGIE